MKRINVLNEETSNKIAAGEVVERPASVVKELIENSIDANAKVINIEILEGGQKYIKITDDGDGIYPEDIEKAFMPHGTSKIKAIEDIYSINTLGFRGEALPSIAAISNTTLRSRISGNDIGSEIQINGGNIQYIKEVGCSLGTTIEVENIFYNVPARQKFLKSSQREAALISDIVERLALANSKISFKLCSNGKVSLKTFSTEKVFDTIRTIYGKNTSDNIIKFEKHNDIASVHGYVGNAEISRGSRNNQSVFINNRYIKNKLIATAVESAVKSFYMINKYPFFVLFLDMYPEYIDVNVHPTKAEVKFQNDREVFKLVFDAVHEAMRDSLRGSFEFEIEQSVINLNETIPEKLETIQLPMDFKHNEKEIEVFYEKPKEIIKEPFKNKEIIVTKALPTIEKVAKFPELKVIGQFHSSYIIAEAFDELYLIDQHAAHEKILFEKYTKEIKENEVSAQILLTPEVIELTSEDYIFYVENKEICKSAGFFIEEFGENTIKLSEVPNFLGKPQLKEFFMSILENLKRLGSGETYEVKYNKIASLSCKAAVKANDVLSFDEMRALINNLRFLEDPFNCPHGRPTIIKMSLMEFEKKFKRIQ